MKCTLFACVQSLISSCFFRDTPVKTTTYDESVTYVIAMNHVTDMEALNMIDGNLFALFTSQILHRYIGI